MLRQLISVSSLIFATIFLLLGNGMFLSLLALRGRYEGFSDQWLGVMSSAYFLGYLLGGYIVPRIIRRMGHIRAFAFFAATLAACILLHTLIIEIHVWVVIRLITGISIVGFYTVIESWFNGSTQPATRARIFAVYMMAEMFSNAAAQQMLRLAPVEHFTLFAVAVIMVCLAMMPIMATRLPQPVVNNLSHLTIRRMWKAAPIAVFGALAAGLTNGTLWTMGALYGKRLGLDTGHVATLMSITIVGGAMLQLPIGRLSDLIDRRKALATAVCGGALAAVAMALLSSQYHLLLVAAFFYGGMVFAIYSMVIAHLMDHLKPQDMMAGSAGVLLLYGIGAIVGPSIAGWLMNIGGARAFPAFFAMVLTPLFIFIVLRTRHQEHDEIVAEPAQFIPARTTATAAEIVVAIEEHRLGTADDDAQSTASERTPPEDAAADNNTGEGGTANTTPPEARGESDQVKDKPASSPAADVGALADDVDNASASCAQEPSSSVSDAAMPTVTAEVKATEGTSGKKNTT